MFDLVPKKGEVLDAMLIELKDIVSKDSQNGSSSNNSSMPLPDTNVWVSSVEEETVGLGNRIGLEQNYSFSLTALKGGRFNALVQFQVWAKELDQVDEAVKEIQRTLLAEENLLRSLGFLRLQAHDVSVADYVEQLEAWRKTADYQVLYEFYYTDTEGAESLISRIPVHINDQYDETIVVSDELVRWSSSSEVSPGDESSGELSPSTLPLEVRGSASHPLQVRAIASLALIPEGWNGQRVVIEVLKNGGVVHQKEFDSLRDFLLAFTTETKPIWLDGKRYLPGIWRFPNSDFPVPIVLKGGGDLFRIRYAASSLEDGAVVYLRVLK